MLPTGDELQRLGITLNEMLPASKRRSSGERGFVADAGHELRTPLALLRAELDFALHHADDEGELRDAVREASVETDRIVQLAGDLLLIASADRDGVPLRIEPIDARQCSRASATASRGAQETGRQLEVEASAHLTLSGDRLRLEQALGNRRDRPRPRRDRTCGKRPADRLDASRDQAVPVGE